MGGDKNYGYQGFYFKDSSVVDDLMRVSEEINIPASSIVSELIKKAIPEIRKNKNKRNFKMTLEVNL